MTGRAGWIALAVALTPPPAQVPAPEPPPAGVTIERGDGVHLRAVLPGRILGYALPVTVGGHRDVVLLVDETASDAPGGPSELPPCPRPEREVRRALYRLDWEGPGALERLPPDPPADAVAIDSVDVDGDGRAELIAAVDAGVVVLGPDGARALVADPLARFQSLHPRVTRTPGATEPRRIVAAAGGRLHVWEPAEPGAAWRKRAEIELPGVAVRVPHGLRVSHLVPELVERDASGTERFAAAPVAVGEQRLQTLLVEIPESGEPRRIDCWARLPSAESVLGSRLLLLDGRAVLLALAKPADRLGLFGEQRIRLFPLEPDRSRSGRAPLLALDSRINIWQQPDPRVLDVDGDGREDLVIGYWKGLADSRIVLDAYVRSPSGSFRHAPRTTAFDVKDGDRSFLHYGDDLDGDGRPDLLLRAEDRYLLFAGRPVGDGSRLVESDARALTAAAPDEEDQLGIEVSVGGGAVRVLTSSLTAPRFVDLDGDRIPEVLWVRPGGTGGAGRLGIVWAVPGRP